MNYKQLKLMVVVMTAALSVAGLAAALCSVGDATADGVFDVADVTVFRRDLAGLGPGVSADCSASATLQLVGFTTEEFLGDAGLFTLTLACQAEFPGSRMCTSIEILNTFDVPSGLVGEAWVRPSHVPVSASGVSTGGIHVGDASGVINQTTLSCNGWSKLFSGTGLTVDSTGAFNGEIACLPENIRSVACCG